jgi:hypothetical protein
MNCRPERCARDLLFFLGRFSKHQIPGGHLVRSNRSSKKDGRGLFRPAQTFWYMVNDARLALQHPLENGYDGSHFQTPLLADYRHDHCGAFPFSVQLQPTGFLGYVTRRRS